MENKTLEEAEAIRQKHIEHLKNNPLSPKHKELVDKLSDPIEFDKEFNIINEDHSE